ncbi:MAG: hypothetical protein V7637_5810 [Mycobacteriales bacterium]|jgi:hypothetical protein
MCCEQLVCASCAGRVSEGQCATCRAYRDAHHGGGPDWAGLAVPLLALLAILLVSLALHSSLS